MRKGAAGVAQLNAQLQALLNPAAPGRAELPLSGSAAAPVMLRVGDRVIQVPRRAARSGARARPSPPSKRSAAKLLVPAVDRDSLLPPSLVPLRCSWGSLWRGPVIFSRRLCLGRGLHSHASACLVRWEALQLASLHARPRRQPTLR